MRHALRIGVVVLAWAGAVSDAAAQCVSNPVVTSTADSGAGTLRQAIADACAGTTITFNLGPGPQTIGLTSGQLEISKNLTIAGPGANLLTVERLGTSVKFRVFLLINSGGTVTLSGMTIAGGDVTGMAAGEDTGGGIYNLRGALTVARVTLTRNRALGGGAIAEGVRGASLVVLDSTVTGNVATGSGGGISVETQQFGPPGGPTLIANTTISDNEALFGGGVYMIGAAPLTIINSTISRNRATANLIVGGGIAGPSSSDGIPVTLRNTIVAGNLSSTPSAPLEPIDIGGSFAVSSAHNLIGAPFGATGITNGVNGNVVGTPASPIDAKLGPLAANGGPTLTHALLAGSPAIDAGLNQLAADAGLTMDQRGQPRVADGPDADITATVDVGAVELAAWVAPLPDRFIPENGTATVTFDLGDADLVTSVTATSLNPVLVPNNPASLTISGTGATRTLTITPAPDTVGMAETVVTVVSGFDSMSDTMLLIVGPLPSLPTGTPTVTSTTTDEDTQTTSGLFVVPNPVDGAIVTHFKITAITGGTLFQNDGTTAIANGGFITAAQGAAGLKFTPSPESFAPGHFTVQSSSAPTDAFLGGAQAVADIVVNPIPDTPLANDLPSISEDGLSPPIRIFRNPADGAEVTHFKITDVTNGTLHRVDGTLIPIGSFIAVTDGLAGVRFLPQPVYVPTATFSVRASLSAADAGVGGGTRVVTVSIAASADVPSVTGAATTEDTHSTSGLVITRNPVDGPEVSLFRIAAIANGTLFKNDGVTPIPNGNYITVAEGAAGLRFRPAANFYGTATVGVRAAVGPGGDGPDVAVATITVSPVADTPSITSATTTAGTQTTSGLVVSRNTADGAEVTHVKVTAVSGGTLFHNDGTTPIAVGSFITFAQANAGLRFTPNSTGHGQVTVRASLSASDAGLGGGSATANIFVSTRTITTGADAPSPSLVKRLSSFGQLIGGPTAEFVAFEGNSGVRVAEADLTNDGVPDIVTGTGFRVPPRVKVFDGATGAVIRDFHPGFGGAGGVFVAAGDVDGDGMADIVTGDNGGSTLVHVFSGASGAPVWTQAIGSAFVGGVRVAAGDVNGDGFADLVVGNGPGAGSVVRVFSGATRAELHAFAPYGGFVGGVYVAAGDVNGDGRADVITGAGATGGPHVKVFDGRTGAERFGFFPYDAAFTGGVRVAAGDVNRDGRADIITAQGAGGNSVRVFDGATLFMIVSPMTGPSLDGAFVSTAVPVNRMVIDAPAAGAVVGSEFRLRGWAFEEGPFGVGIDYIHVWAYPTTGAAPIFLGWATLGDPRPDIGATFGAQYANAGYHLDVTGLAEGTYDVTAYAHNSTTGIFDMQRVVSVRVVGPGVGVPIALDGPSVRTVLPDFDISGWAFDVGSPRGDSGIEFVHVYAFPHAGGAPIFLGWGTLGGSRPDVAAVFGPRAARSGFQLNIGGLPAGTYTLAVYPKAYANPFFSPPAFVTITVTTAATDALYERER